MVQRTHLVAGREEEGAEADAAQVGVEIAKPKLVWEKCPPPRNAESEPKRTRPFCSTLECCNATECGRSSMAERQLPKLHTRVRFPSPAPILRPVVRKGDAATSVNREKPQRSRDDGDCDLGMILIASPASILEVRVPASPYPSCINSAPAHIRRARRRSAADLHRPAGAPALACVIGA